MKDTSTSAFSLVELILVVAIVAILAAAGAPFLSRFILVNDLEVSTDKVVGTIRKAQAYAMDNKNDATWGVCMSGTNLRLFSGSCASPTHSEDFDVSEVTITGLTTTTFSGIAGRRGEPSGTLNVTISNSLGSKTVTLNAAGGMDRN